MRTSSRLRRAHQRDHRGRLWHSARCRSERAGSHRASRRHRHHESAAAGSGSRDRTSRRASQPRPSRCWMPRTWVVYQLPRGRAQLGTHRARMFVSSSAKSESCSSDESSDGRATLSLLQRDVEQQRLCRVRARTARAAASCVHHHHRPRAATSQRCAAEHTAPATSAVRGQTDVRETRAGRWTCMLAHLRRLSNGRLGAAGPCGCWAGSTALVHAAWASAR